MFRVVPVRVAVVDDEALVREAWVALLESDAQFRVVASAGDHEAAITATASAATATITATATPTATATTAATTAEAGDRPADVALLDLGVVRPGVAPTVRPWRTRLPGVGLVLVDDLVRDVHLRQALRAGVSYVTKRDRFADLADVLLRTAHGEQAFSCEARRRLLPGPRGWELHVTQGPPGLHLLTPRETEVLTRLAEGHSLKRCSELLAVSGNTVDHHKARIMKKLGLRNMVDLVRLAMREGLLPG